MPRFNIFKAFSKNKSLDQSKESKSLDRAVSTSEQPSLQDDTFQDDTTNDKPFRKPRTKLTKRRPSVSQAPIIQPSYSVRSEDLGYHDLGRYPTKVPEPILADLSNPANYRDTHPRFVEDTRLEYPTTNNESFNPMSQSSKRWTPIPDVYRDPPTEEYGDNTNLIGESSGPHYHQPHRGARRDAPLPTRPRHSSDKRRRRRSEPGNGSQRSDNSTVGMNTHTTDPDSREMPSNARFGDTTGIRYVQDNVHDGVFQQGVSMRATPLNLSARKASLSSRSRAIDEVDGRAGHRSDVVEPVVFEHEVPREDGDPSPKIWHYIVPGGLDVIFKDEDGNELTRVKNTGGRSSKRRITPMVIEDEQGNVIHRMGDFESEAGDDFQTRSDSNHQRGEPYESRYQKSGSLGNADSEPVVRAPAWMNQRSGSPTGHVYTSYLSPDADKVFLIDQNGRQIPIADRKKRSSARRKRPHGSTGQ